MEVPTKWSRASVISFIKGLGKHAGVSSCTSASLLLSLYRNTLLSIRHGDLSHPGISVSICSLQVRPHGHERPVSRELLGQWSSESEDVCYMKVSISSDKEHNFSSSK